MVKAAREEGATGDDDARKGGKASAAFYIFRSSLISTVFNRQKLVTLFMFLLVMFCLRQTVQYCQIFTCGRRPAGHVMMSVVGVVVVVVGGGGGEQLLYMGPPRAHVWFSKIQKKDPVFFI